MVKKLSVKAIKNIDLRSHIIPISLMLVSVGMFFYIFTSESPSPESAVQAPVYRAKAKALAVSITETLQPIRNRLRELAERADLEDKLIAEPSTLLAQNDAELPGLLALRLLRPSATDTLDDEVPPLSFACFDMVYEAVNAKQDAAAIPVEVHLFGSASQHVDFVQVVRNSKGVAVGALLASFNIGVLQQYLSGLTDIDGAIELQQARQVLASGGSKGERAMAAYRAPVKGTRWIVSYWPATDKTKQIIDFANQQFLLVSGFASLILLIALGLFLRTWLKNRRLEEVEVTEPGPETMMRKVAESVTDASSEDLLFQSGEGLVVEEVEEDSDPKNIASSLHL